MSGRTRDDWDYRHWQLAMARGIVGSFWADRPQVNPDRHARIRQRHFHQAARRQETGYHWLANPAAWPLCAEGVPLDELPAILRFLLRSLDAHLAFGNCSWGCS